MTAPYWSNGVATLYQADARAIPLPDGSVHCCITSPPYFGLRDYQLGDVGIGLEPTLSDWLANILAVSREVWRVLRDDGTYWLNLGDAYAASGKGPTTIRPGQTSRTDVDVGGWGAGPKGEADVVRGKRTPRGEGSGRWGMGDTAVDGLPAKNLMGQPWRAAFALQDDGWILRSAIVWHKPNPMPESVSDRPTSAYEMVFLLTKRPHYFYDADAIRERGAADTARLSKTGKHGGVRGYYREEGGHDSGLQSFRKSLNGEAPRINSRNLWTIPTQGRPEAHFATFPDELPRRCILAGTSEHGVCAECGAPWERQTERTLDPANTVVVTRRKEYSDVEKSALAAYLTSRRMEKGLSRRFVDEALGTNTMYSFYEGRKTRTEVPTPAQWDKLKSVLDLDDQFDDLIHATVEVAVSKASVRSDDLLVKQDFSSGGKETVIQTVGWQPTCDHNAARIPATVLDPFIGSGTTVAVAQQLGRHGIGLDLNPDYLAIAAKRLAGITLPMAI